MNPLSINLENLNGLQQYQPMLSTSNPIVEACPVPGCKTFNILATTAAEHGWRQVSEDPTTVTQAVKDHEAAVGSRAQSL